jgi:glycogen debranching enzyme
MGRIATVLGLSGEARKWSQRAEAMAARMVRHMWDEAAGEFMARANGRRIDVATPFGLFPLLTGRLPEALSRRLVERLTDPARFWPRFPVPTVALDDPRYDPAQMWRGPTWINVNYLLIEGLRRSGFPEVAAELRRRTLELIAGHSDVYEYYDPSTGEPPPRAAPIFGWSAALFIELMLQEQAEASLRSATAGPADIG